MPYIIRNLRQGTLVIGLSNIVLAPGGQKQVEELSEPIVLAARRGFVEILGAEEEAPQSREAPDVEEEVEVSLASEHQTIDEEEDGEPIVEPLVEPAPEEEEPRRVSQFPTSLADYNAVEAIQYVSIIVQRDLLAALRESESRKTVLAAIDKRLKELEG